MATSAPRPRYSVAQKLEIVQYAQANSVKAACIRFNVARSSIYLWSGTESALARSLCGRQHVLEEESVATATSSAPSENTQSARALSTPFTQEHDEHHEGRERARQPPNRTDVAQRQADLLHIAHEREALPVETQRTSTDQHTGGFDMPRQSTFVDEETPIDFAVVGYQGASGGFAQLSAHRTFSALLSVQTLPFPAFETTGYPQVSYVLDALQRGEIDYAIVATDMLLSNTHHASLDKLVASRLRMIGEVVSQEEICVCALPGTELCDADCVISDWSTLQRCEEYILQLELQYGRRIYRQVTWDSVAGCRTIQEEQAENTLALCSTIAATTHGLVVLQNRVTRAPSSTRYTALGRHGTAPLSFGNIQEEEISGVAQRRCTLLVKGTERAILDVISAFAYRGLEIVSFHMRGGGDGDQMRSYVISYNASPNPLIERSLQHHLAAAAERVVVLGNYMTHTS